MPRYDFECVECRAALEVQATVPEYAALQENESIGCPACGSKKVVRVFSAPGLVSDHSNPSRRCCPEGACK